MSAVLKLEEFAKSQIMGIENFSSEFDQIPGQNPDVPENAAFEKGYKAGWEDASAAEAQNQTRISEELSRNIQDFGFTYHEARNHVLKSLENLITELVEKVLPEIAFDSLGLAISQELIPLAKLAIDAPISIVVSPVGRPALETLLDEFCTIPFELVEETSLSSGQVFMRAGKFEKQIDFSKVLETASLALSTLYQTNEQVLKHG